jgi:hypothetical protein
MPSGPADRGALDEDYPGARVTQEYFDLLLQEDGIVWLRRRAVPYPSLDEVHRAYDEFLAVVDQWASRRPSSGTPKRASFAWMYDVRGAPSQRDDEEFQNVVAERRADLVARSPLLAVVVNTGSGYEQLSRMAQQAKEDLLFFDDPDEARGQLRWRMHLASEVR